MSNVVYKREWQVPFYRIYTDTQSLTQLEYHLVQLGIFGQRSFVSFQAHSGSGECGCCVIWPEPCTKDQVKPLHLLSLQIFLLPASSGKKKHGKINVEIQVIRCMWLRRYALSLVVVHRTRESSFFPTYWDMKNELSQHSLLSSVSGWHAAWYGMFPEWLRQASRVGCGAIFLVMTGFRPIVFRKLSAVPMEDSIAWTNGHCPLRMPINSCLLCRRCHLLLHEQI